MATKKLTRFCQLQLSFAQCSVLLGNMSRLATDTLTSFACPLPLLLPAPLQPAVFGGNKKLSKPNSDAPVAYIHQHTHTHANTHTRAALLWMASAISFAVSPSLSRSLSSALSSVWGCINDLFAFRVLRTKHTHNTHVCLPLTASIYVCVCVFVCVCI